MTTQFTPTVTVTIDPTNRRDELNERLDAGDAPNPSQRLYFAGGHRVFFHGDLGTNAPQDVIEAYRPMVERAIAAEYGITNPGAWHFSQYAGCDMCACSPGFVLLPSEHHTPAQLMVHVTIPKQ